MIEAFDGFKAKSIDADPVPVRWFDEQIVYGLCDGDITKRKYVLDNIRYLDAQKWFLHRRYSQYVDGIATKIT